MFQILTLGITNRERNRKKLNVFKLNKYIVKTRLNFNQSATLKYIEDGKAYNLIYRSYYILHDDIGANSSSDNKLQQIKDPRELTKNNKDLFSYNNNDVSLFQLFVKLLGKLSTPNINIIKVKGKVKVTGKGSEKKQKNKNTSYNNKSKNPVITIEGKSNYEKTNNNKVIKHFQGYIYSLSDINNIRKQNGEIKFYILTS